MKNDWLEKNTFHYSEFNDLDRLVDEKRKKNLKISLCLPTLNEEKTIAKEILIMKSELMTRYPILDEIVVVDSGSTDKTREVARAFGADVYEAKDILPDLENFKGKGYASSSSAGDWQQGVLTSPAFRKSAIHLLSYIPSRMTNY